MRSSTPAKKQRTAGNSSSRKRSSRRISNQVEGNYSDDNFFFRIVIPNCNSAASSASPNTLSVMAVMMLSVFVVIVSRLNCFHVHYGLSESLRNIESVSSTRKDGYTNFHFTGKVNAMFDQEALDILKENPEIKIEDLDLGFVFDMDQFGADAFDIGKRGRNKTSIKSVGKPTNELSFHITGERIRTALQKREARMPRPFVQQ